MKKYKVLSIDCNGRRLDCIFDSTKNCNPYTLYKKWNEITETGIKQHRKKIVSYQNFDSVICYLRCLSGYYPEWQ